MIIETKIEREGCQPYRANNHDAGADLISLEERLIPAGGMAVLRSGVSMSIPSGYVGLVFSRSGHGKRGLRLANSVGVIDSGYSIGSPGSGGTGGYESQSARPVTPQSTS